MISTCTNLHNYYCSFESWYPTQSLCTRFCIAVHENSHNSLYNSWFSVKLQRIIATWSVAVGIPNYLSFSFSSLISTKNVFLFSNFKQSWSKYNVNSSSFLGCFSFFGLLDQFCTSKLFRGFKAYNFITGYKKWFKAYMVPILFLLWCLACYDDQMGFNQLRTICNLQKNLIGLLQPNK
jgi:hypothetical protein